MERKFFITVLSIMLLCLILCIVQLARIEYGYEIANLLEEKRIITLGPMQVAKQYILALKKKDYRIAYSFLTPDSREKFSLADFVNLNEQGMSGLDENQTWITQEVVLVGMQIYEDPGSWGFVMVKTDGKWRIIMKSGIPSFPYTEEGGCFFESHSSNTLNNVKIRFNDNGIELKQGRNIYRWKEGFLGVKEVLRDDIDGDKREEYIICTMLHDEEGFPDGYIFVCKKEGNEIKIRQKIRMYCNFRDAQTREITDDNAMDLIIYGSGGVHCDYLQIYSYREGKLIALFDKNSSAGIEFKFDENYKPQIWVGRENWQDPEWCYAKGRRLWEVHVWNGREFEYSKELSTSPFLSQRETAGQHIEKVKEYLKP